MSGALAAMGGGRSGVINTSLPPGADTGTAQFQLLSNGTYSISGSAAGNWVTPALAGVAALYSVQVDVTAGAFNTGTTGSQLTMDSTRTWSLTSAGAATFNVTWHDRFTGQQVAQQTGITLNAL